MRRNALFSLQFLGGLHGKMQRQTIGNYRNVIAFAQQIGFADRNGIVAFRHVFLDQLVALLVLEEEHRVRIAHSRLQ
ncbi:hypothetical protein D3C72_2285550 [compost metagenome]